MKKLNIIFPMSGESSRFNYKFKPFLQISDLTFIELAFKYFKKYINSIKRVYFVVTEEQNLNNNVEQKLKHYFKEISYELIVLKNKTKSHYETIRTVLCENNILGETIICDCDHSIDIEPMMNYLNKTDVDILVPYWKLNEHSNNNWDKIITNKEKNAITKFNDKLSESEYGIIGCIYFKNVELMKEHNYDAIIAYLNYELVTSNLNMDIVQITNASFFGTKEILDRVIDSKKKEITTFCDLDGTIIHHEAQPKYENNEILLEGVIEKLTYLKKSGKVIITTARSKKEEIKKILKNLNIPYDDIITDLPSGTRLLINDIKPSMPYTLMSKSYNVNRNEGMSELNFENLINSDNIIKQLKGGSYSNCCIIKKKNDVVVRKIIYKRNIDSKHYQKLKLQKYNIERFNCYVKDISPKIIHEEDNDLFYYYDMKYLKNYKPLSEVDYNKYFPKLFTILKNEIYTMKKKNYNDKWLQEYMNKKINLNNYESLSENIRKIINMDSIKINGIYCMGFKNIILNLLTLDLNDNYNPKYLSPIHGDLTLENIMICENTCDIKLIDLDGGDFIDAIELDLGKLFQSTLSKYELWSNDNPILNINFDKNIIDTKEYLSSEELLNFIDKFKIWKDILEIQNEKHLFKVGIFYMIIHLFRMIPFRYKCSENQAIYAIKEIIYWYTVGETSLPESPRKKVNQLVSLR